MAKYISLNNMKTFAEKQKDKFDEIDNEFANVYKEFESNKAKVSDVLGTHQADIMVLKDRVANLTRGFLTSITIIITLIVMAFVLGFVIGCKNGEKNVENKNLDNATTAVAAVDISSWQFGDIYDSEVNEYGIYW